MRREGGEGGVEGAEEWWVCGAWREEREKGEVGQGVGAPRRRPHSVEFFFPFPPRPSLLLAPLSKTNEAMSLTAGACARMRAPGFDCGEAVVLKVRGRKRGIGRQKKRELFV